MIENGSMQGRSRQQNRRTRGMNHNQNPRDRRENINNQDMTKDSKSIDKSSNSHSYSYKPNVDSDIKSKHTIPELFKDDSIDFTVKDINYYIESFIANGTTDMYPILNNLEVDYLKMKDIEEQIQRVLSDLEQLHPADKPLNKNNTQNMRRRVRL